MVKTSIGDKMGICPECFKPWQIHGTACDYGYTKRNKQNPTHETKPTGQNNTLLKCNNKNDWIELRKTPNHCPICGDKL